MIPAGRRTRACRRAVLMYLAGRGVAKNEVAYLMWAGLAVDNAQDALARKKYIEAFDLVAKLMSPKQIAEVQALVSNCADRKFKGCQASDQANKKTSRSWFFYLPALCSYLLANNCFSMNKENTTAPIMVPTEQTVAIIAIFFSSREN